MGDPVFRGIDGAFAQLDESKNSAARFVFGVNPQQESGAESLPPDFTLLRTFAFGVLPTIIVFAALMSILYYYGVIQWIVKMLAKLMQATFGHFGVPKVCRLLPTSSWVTRKRRWSYGRTSPE